MRRATFLAAASADLVAILTYIADESGSVAVAELFVQSFAPSVRSWQRLMLRLAAPVPNFAPTFAAFPTRAM